MSTPSLSSGIRLAGYSFLILFFELALIRYVPAYVRVFGFYLNFVLIATFLGMGVGLLRSAAALKLRWIGPIAAVTLLATVKYFSNVVIDVPADPDEALWGVFFEIAPTVRRFGILPTVTIIFALCTLFFIPLGALLGREFRNFKPLSAYSIDILGSLLGIVAFGVFSAWRTPPVLWFAVGGGLWVILSLRDKWFAGTLVAATGATVLVAVSTAVESAEYWSPYYRINVVRQVNRLSINVNGSFHQTAINFDSAEVARDPALRRIWRDYRLPFAFLDVPDTVLVVGAGSGNDVALLLQLGVKHVDAVEIDPVILDIGRAGHFQQPYSDPRVETFLTDAREFLRNTERTYDLIIFGTLDSQTLLSGMSSLRLDNYVYTVEAFRDARRRLKQGGSLITYHMSPEAYIAAKIYRIIEVAFEEPPALAYNSDHRLFNYVFIAGAAAKTAMETWGAPVVPGVDDVSLPRDNWPYLYLRRHTVPAHYLHALGAVLAVAVLAVGVGGGRAVVQRFDWTMFFMGAGFLLLETKSVTEMSLLFGATWQVNMLVFLSILVMILAANYYVARRPPQSLKPLFLSLFIVLAVASVIPARALLWLGPFGEWVTAGLIVATPVFFAAIIFAMLFRHRANATGALGANLLGAVVGGVVEYSSMIVGVKALYLLAAISYALAYGVQRLNVQRPTFERPVSNV